MLKFLPLKFAPVIEEQKKFHEVSESSLVALLNMVVLPSLYLKFGAPKGTP